MDFIAFMKERGKENNTYFIDVFEIENVEVRLVENGSRKYRDIVLQKLCFIKATKGLSFLHASTSWDLLTKWDNILLRR